ncbi:hypothetical protein JNW90_07255 [Micromonospora sp. STR1s_5]|nr:hypothetical protein [Micromonospora sp. STR1s_5]
MIASELPAAQAWAARRPGWTVDLNEDAGPLLIVGAVHPGSGTLVRITADLSGYPAIPPAWRFTDRAGGSAAPFPQPGGSPVVPGSIFHSNRLICAPWNRLAYAEHGGPHPDWGALANWKTAGAGYTKANTLADMLSQIHLHLTLSPGMS